MQHLLNKGLHLLCSLRRSKRFTPRSLKTRCVRQRVYHFPKMKFREKHPKFHFREVYAELNALLHALNAGS